MPMTPEEELFAKFFNDEKKLIGEMSDLELRAHRDSLSKVAFEARARLTAIQEETGERIAKGKKSKAFNALPLETDDITSNAINEINKRKEKKSKIETQIENMVKMGIDRAVAEKMFEASTVLALKKKKTNETINHDNLAKAETLIKSIRGKCPTCLFDFENKVEGLTTCPKCSTKVTVEKMVMLSNPFGQPTETPKVIEAEPKVEIAVIEPEPEEKPKSFNPFG